MKKQGYKFFKDLINKLIKLDINTDSAAHSLITGAYTDNKIDYEEYYKLNLYYEKKGVLIK